MPLRGMSRQRSGYQSRFRPFRIAETAQIACLTDMAVRRTFMTSEQPRV